MTAEEIRNIFGYNSVIGILGYTGFHDEDMKQITRMAIVVMGELAAQIAESIVEQAIDHHGIECDCQTCADSGEGKWRKNHI